MGFLFLRLLFSLLPILHLRTTPGKLQIFFFITQNSLVLAFLTEYDMLKRPHLYHPEEHTEKHDGVSQ